MPDRSSGCRPLMAANWKLHKTASETIDFFDRFLPLVSEPDCEVVVCPTFTSLAAAVECASASAVKVAAQNMHEEAQGAFTGEVSTSMLAELGVDGVILGHSERRAYFNELDRSLQKKVPAALAANLMPILCVGETEAEREAGDTQRRLRTQVQEALEKVPDHRVRELVIAYEPVWAIGTGRAATAEAAQEAIAFVRALVGDRNSEAAEHVRVLYGGSVKADNVAEFMAQEDIDGALVGGASLDPTAFAELVAAAG